MSIESTYMFITALIKLYVILYGFITWKRFSYGLFLFFLLLPAYMIRTKLFTLPSTLLEVMLFILFVVWFGQSLIQKNFRQQFTILKTHITNNYNYTLLAASFIFLLAATISVFTSINMRAALGEWKAFYIEPFLFFLLLIIVIKTKKQINDILFALVLCGLLTSILAIYQHFTGWMVPWTFWQNRNTFRVTGWYGFPNAVGLFIAPLVPLAIYLIKENYKKNNLIVICSLLFSIFAIPAIYFAKSTGGLIGVVAGVAILLLFWKKTRLSVCLVSLAGLVSLACLSPANPIKQELLMQDRSGQIRVQMWGETIEFLTDNPITGAGLASYQTLIYPYRIDKWIEVFHHPHNIFLTMWVNLGILGLFGFVWIVVWFFRVGLIDIFYYKNKNEFIYFLLSTMIVFITTGLVDSPYIKNDMAMLFWLLPAFMVLSSGLPRGRVDNQSTLPRKGTGVPTRHSKSLSSSRLFVDKKIKI